MKVTDVLVLASLAVLVVALTHVHAAPSELERYLDDRDNDRLADWLLSHIADYRRDRRAQFDAGFMVRHNTLKNFLHAIDAGMEAADPHGPGRRK